MKRSSYWYIRLLTEREARPLFVGLVTGAALLMIFLIWVAMSYWLGGNVHFSVLGLGIEALFIVLASYFVAVTVHTLVMTSRDVLALASALNLDENRLAHEAAKVTEQSSAPPIWTVCWILAVIVLTWWISRMAIDDSTPVIDQFQPVIEGWPHFRNLVYVFILSQFIWIDVALAHRLGKLLGEHGKVNLLDRSGFSALSKRTRRHVLVWIPLLVHSILFLVLLLAVVILPATGIRRRYIEERDRQLRKVRTRIADRSAAVVDDSSTLESTNLPELVAWEQRLQQVKVWPYNTTMYSRVFLYGGIGLASWIGAALVECLLGAFFG